MFHVKVGSLSSIWEAKTGRSQSLRLALITESIPGYLELRIEALSQINNTFQ